MNSVTFASEAAAAVNTVGFPLLPAMVLLPLLGAIGIAFVPRERVDLARTTAILVSLGTGALSLYLLGAFDKDDGGFQFVTRTPWITQLDINLSLGVDGISLFLVVLTGILFPIALFAARPTHDEKAYYAWITLLEVGCMGVFLSLDLFLFFLCFEITLIPLYMLIGRWGHGRRVYAANKFFLYTMLGSMLMLVAIVVLATQGTPDGKVSFDLLRIAEQGGIKGPLGTAAFFGFAIAFCVKTPVVPFHTWLPDAHTEAPTAGSVDLAGVLLKLGTYGFLRYGLYLFPEQSKDWAWLFMVLATVGIIYGAITAAMQKNLKRLVAYSSVSHMGFAILGLFALTTIGIEGSVMVMINHGIATGALFILLGYIYTRRHTYEIAELRGLAKVAPVLGGLFTVVMLASIGVPGLNGFVGEFLVLLGTYVSSHWYAVVAATGVILAALYLLWAYQRSFHGEPDEANRLLPDLTWAERAAVAPLIALIVFLGVYPKPVLERIEPSVQRLMAHVEAKTGYTEPQPDRAPAPEAEGHGGIGEAPGAGAEHATGQGGE